MLLTLVNELKPKPKTYVLGCKPKVIFQDIGFKLWIINELMYLKKKISPQFVLKEFIAEYEKREIDIESEGYAIIPEALKYFKNLDIPSEELALLERITVKDNNSQIMDQIWPFYDPGCGDQLISVTDLILEDIKHLPNLKTIIGFKFLKPSQKIITYLSGAGVKLLDSDTV